MLDPVYCIKCRKGIEAPDCFCKHCGADQRHPSKRSPVEAPSPIEVPADVVSSESEPMLSPPAPDPELEALRLELRLESEAKLRHRPYLRLRAHRLFTTEDGRTYVIGIVQNNAFENCLEAEIGIKFRDADGSHVGFLMDRTYEIEQQTDWKFAILVPYPGVTEYTIVSLRGDYFTYRLEAEEEYERMRRQQELLEDAAAEEAFVNWQRDMQRRDMRLRQLEAKALEREEVNRSQETWSVWISFPFG